MVSELRPSEPIGLIILLADYRDLANAARRRDG